MANDSYSRFDEDKVHTFVQLSQEKLVRRIHTAPYIAWNVIEIIDLILETHSTEYTWEAF